MTASEPSVTHPENARGTPRLDLIEYAWPNSALSAPGHSRVMIVTASVMITSSHAPACPAGWVVRCLVRWVTGQVGRPRQSDELAATRWRPGGLAVAG